MQKITKKIFLYGLTVLVLLPALVSAQAPQVPFPGENDNAVYNLLQSILLLLWSVFATFAVIAFITAGFLFLTANGDAGQVGKARQAVIWGAVGVGVALISVSIPFILKNMLGV